MKLLIDTNIYIDVLLKREPFFDDSKAVFEASRERHDVLFCTPQTFRDVGYVASRFFHDSSKGKEAQFLVYQMTDKFIGIAQDDAINALFEESSDYEDCLQMLAADRNLLEGIITNNPKDYGKAKVPVFTAHEYVNFLYPDKS